eukprot:COSAG01_NODE_5278_length_4363_cov_175.868433_6_plen_59_part_00
MLATQPAATLLQTDGVAWVGVWLTAALLGRPRAVGRRWTRCSKLSSSNNNKRSRKRPS